MEQAMGYASAMGTMLMDKVAGVCGQAKEWFTSIWTDIGKAEMELLKACDWSTRVQDWYTLSGQGHLLTLTAAALRYSLTLQTLEDQTTGKQTV